VQVPGTNEWIAVRLVNVTGTVEAESEPVRRDFAESYAASALADAARGRHSYIDTQEDRRKKRNAER
jgi:hypothetical protein